MKRRQARALARAQKIQETGRERSRKKNFSSTKIAISKRKQRGKKHIKQGLKKMRNTLNQHEIADIMANELHGTETEKRFVQKTLSEAVPQIQKGLFDWEKDAEQCALSFATCCVNNIPKNVEIRSGQQKCFNTRKQEIDTTGKAKPVPLRSKQDRRSITVLLNETHQIKADIVPT